MSERINFLWDSNVSYNEWKQSVTKRPQEYIEDLNLEHIFNELNSISSFIDFSIHKNTFSYPCSRLSTIRYRQSIIKALYESKWLHKTIKEFTVALRDIHKKLIDVNKTRDEVKKRIFFLQMYRELLYKLQYFYNELIKGIPEDNVFNRLTVFLSEYVLPDHMSGARESLTLLQSKLRQLYSFNIILNKKEEQIIYSAAIADDTNHNSEAPGNSVGDKLNDKLTIHYESVKNHSFSEKLLSISHFILEDYDFNISVYQDVDITSFDKELQVRVMDRAPDVLADINRLYLQFKDFPFHDFFDMADELIFYITYIDFMNIYEEAGFYFTLPDHSPDRSRMRAAGAYDLSLGINRYRTDKYNNLVSNSFAFDEDNRIFILTGANQGGKTTFLRSIGILQCLYQIGVYVPAKSATLCIVNQIYTHFSRADEASAGAGRFEKELIMLQRLLAGISPGDMFLLNEPFTSTQRSIAVVLLKYALAELSKQACYGGLVTHFFELTGRLSGSPFFSLVTLVKQADSFNERTYVIARKPSDNKSHADDIARKCGVTYKQLTEAIKSRL